MEFCSEFDRRLAHTGPPAVFLLDRDGKLRMQHSWTRDVWGRAETPSDNHEWVWLLLRDHATGFVQLALVTSPDLLDAHPRQDVRTYPSFEAADEARRAFGDPPLCEAPW